MLFKLWLFINTNKLKCWTQSSKWMQQEKAAYITHLEPVISCSAFQEGPVKIIPIVCNINTRLHLSHVGKPLFKKLNLQATTSHTQRKGCATVQLNRELSLPHFSHLSLWNSLHIRVLVYILNPLYLPPRTED